MKPLANVAAFIGAVVLYIVLTAALGGCGLTREEVQRGIEGGRDFQNFAAPIIAERQRAEEAACNGDAACVAAVQERYEIGAAVPMKAFHGFWCAVAPNAEGCP